MFAHKNDFQALYSRKLQELQEEREQMERDEEVRLTDYHARLKRETRERELRISREIEERDRNASLEK